MYTTLTTILLLWAGTSSVLAFPANPNGNANPARAADPSPSSPPLARGLPIPTRVADTETSIPWTVIKFVTDPVEPPPWTVGPLITPAPNPVTDPIEFQTIATRFDLDDLQKFKDKLKDKHKNIPVADPPKQWKRDNSKVKRWDCDDMPMLPRPDDGTDGTMVRRCDPTPWDGPDGPDSDGLVV